MNSSLINGSVCKYRLNIKQVTTLEKETDLMMEEDYGLVKAVTKLYGIMSSHIKEVDCKVVLILIKYEYINH